MLDSASNQPSKFRTRNWVEINDESRSEYSSNKLIRFKTAMLRSSLCDYSDAYNTAGGAAAANNTNKKVIFKNCAPFTDCISKINRNKRNTAIIIQKHLEAYGNFVKIYLL